MSLDHFTKSNNSIKNLAIARRESMSTNDEILSGFTAQKIILTVICNEPIKDEKTVKKVFEELLTIKINEARKIFNSQLETILEEVKGQ